MNKVYLHQQIDRYFEAQLTQQEEASLLKTLLKIEGQDPVADEALAVMLASRMPLNAARARKTPRIMQIAGIAASIALILGIGVFLIRQPRQNDSFAYVAGKKIQDPIEINNIVATQLQDIGESTGLFSQALSADLDDIREALIADDYEAVSH